MAFDQAVLDQIERVLTHEPRLTGIDGGPYSIVCACGHWRPPQGSYERATNALEAFAGHTLAPNEPRPGQESRARG